jgi:TonB-linked SusC/RagA family outer membrane protein
VAVVASDAVAQRRVTGQVTASTGEPLSAVTVQVVGTTAGALTNEQGRFSVVVPANATTLRFRRIGYAQRQVALAAGQAEVTVRLERDVLQLEQVVVTGQTTTTERRNATTATAIVSTEEVLRAPAPSVENALQGKVVGANINLNSGAPGGGGQIQIRGVTSILGSGQPLIVVDGVIISNEANSAGVNAITQAAPGAANISSTQDNPLNRLADINPNDIESVEVLKSAAATAIYGSRATNGVILIRTKRGVAGQTRATLTQRVGTQSALRLPGQRRFETAAEAFEYADAYGVDSAAVAGIIAANGGTVPYNRFDKQFFDRGTPSYESILSASGGSERTQFFVSGTNRQENGIAPRTGARLQSGRVNLDQTFNARLRGSVGVAFTRNETNRGLSNNDNSYTSPLYAFPYTPSFLPLRRNADGTFPENIAQGGGANISNPFQTFQFLDLTEDTYRTIGSGNLTYTAFQDARNRVDLVGLFGVDRSQSEGSVLSPGFLQFEPNDGFLGTSQQSNASTRNINTSLSANHTFTGGTFQVVSSVGTTYEEQQQNLYRIAGEGNLPGVPRSDVGSLTNVQQTFFLFRDQSVFLNTQLTALTERLNVAAGVRADRSSANGDPEKFFVFPRASASFRFDGPLPGIDNIKPRVAYGQTGNRPRYGDRDILLSNGGVIGGRTGIVANTVVGNQNIRPEALVEQEYGVDVSLFRQRAQIEATYYDRTINDFLLQPTVALSTGLTNLVVNAGEMQTTGLELAANLIPVQTRNFNWLSRITYQTFESVVRDLPSFIAPFVIPNSGFGTFGRGRIAEGVSATAIWANAPIDAQGRFLPVGTTITNPAAVRATRDTVVADSRPDFQMFFTNTFRVRNVGLSFLLDWRKGAASGT